MEDEMDEQEKRGREMLKEFEQTNNKMKQILEQFSYSPELTAKFNATWIKIRRNQAETLAMRQKRLADTKKQALEKQQQQARTNSTETGHFSRLISCIWFNGSPPKGYEGISSKET